MLLDVILKDSKTEVEVELEKDPNNNIWIGYASIEKDGDFKIFFELNKNNELKSYSIGPKIYQKNVKEQFLAKFLEFKNREVEQELTGIDEEDEESEIDTELKPYDPELIRVDPKIMSISYIYEMISDKDLDLSPDFQRNFVWTDITRKSRLIESILLRIPLPVFYLSQDEDGILHVVDGVQRLTVIRDFLDNKFKLQNLEYLTDCEGCFYNKPNENCLQAKYVRRIKQTQLYNNIIDSTTPFNVKFEIFKRINTGGKPLKYQEIRNCAAKSQVRTLLSNLAESPEFVLATNNSVSSIRMEDHELIMRFIGFYYYKILSNVTNPYRGKTKNFLDITLEILNAETAEGLSKISIDFKNSMKNSHYLFGEYAFRKCKCQHLKPGAKRQLINKTLFTALSVLLSKYSYDKISENNPPRALLIPLAKELENNPSFYDAITIGTNDQKKTQHVFDIVEKIIDSNLVKIK